MLNFFVPMGTGCKISINENLPWNNLKYINVYLKTRIYLANAVCFGWSIDTDEDEL